MPLPGFSGGCADPSRSARVGVVALVVAYIGASLYRITLPGVYHDEVILVNPAFDVLSGALPIFGDVPYVGALKAYLHAPVVAFAGGSVLGLRAVPVILTAVTACILYRVVARLVQHEWAALAAMALFLFHPAVFFSARLDDGPVSTQMLAVILVILFVSRAIQNNAPRDLLIAGAWAAVGCWQKAYFVWLILAGLATLAIYRRSLTLPLRSWIGAAALAFTGCIPMLAVSLWQGWSAVTSSAAYEVDPGVIASKLDYLNEVLSGQAGIVWIASERLAFPVMAPALIGAAAVAAVVAPPSRHRLLARITLLVVFLIVLQVLLSGRGGLSIRHYALIFPLLPIAVVAANLALRRGAILMLLGVVAVLVTQVMALGGYYGALQRTGGVKVWSEATYELTDLVRVNPSHRWVALDWGISESVRFLSDGHDAVPLIPWIYPDTPQPTEAELEALFGASEARFVLHADEALVFRRGRDALRHYAHTTGRALVREREFSDRLGRPVLVIYRIDRDRGES